MIPVESPKPLPTCYPTPNMPVIVEAVCISTPGRRVAKEPREQAYCAPAGFEGDRHAGETRISSRSGGPIPNRRQWSAVSTDEVEAFCRELGVAPFAFGEMGENIRLRGIHLASVTPGTVLEFPSGCRLQVSTQNDPCDNAAEELSLTYGPAVRRYFVKASFGRRGVVGTVLAPGLIRPGDEVSVRLPRPASSLPA
ncbi:MAG TPA: MOSC domain-containing protein [Dehalococcoidia bacterium]|nr:MOSC domain-containing protein [Dehalococcoidia bacterium]